MEYRGADAYREAWADMFSQLKGNPQIEVAGQGITVDGTVAFGHCFMHVTGTDTQGHLVNRWPCALPMAIA